MGSSVLDNLITPSSRTEFHLSQCDEMIPSITRRRPKRSCWAQLHSTRMKVMNSRKEPLHRRLLIGWFERIHYVLSCSALCIYSKMHGLQTWIAPSPGARLIFAIRRDWLPWLDPVIRRSDDFDYLAMTCDAILENTDEEAGLDSEDILKKSCRLIESRRRTIELATDNLQRGHSCSIRFQATWIYRIPFFRLRLYRLGQ